MVSRINSDRGTNLAYVFVTLCIVSPAARFTLASEYVAQTDTPTLIGAVRDVIEAACQTVSITRIYCDRGLYRIELVDALNDFDVEFVMRAPKTRGIKRILSEHDEETFVTDYELVKRRVPPMRVPVTLVVVPHQSRDDDSLCLITNRQRTLDEAMLLAQAYRRRWGIETSCRKIREFLPRTTSPVFVVRLFYFLLAVALHNLWIVVCLLPSEQRRMKTRPSVSTATFRLFFRPVTYGQASLRRQTRACARVSTPLRTGKTDGCRECLFSSATAYSNHCSNNRLKPDFNSFDVSQRTLCSLNR